MIFHWLVTRKFLDELRGGKLLLFSCRAEWASFFCRLCWCTIIHGWKNQEGNIQWLAHVLFIQWLNILFSLPSGLMSPSGEQLAQHSVWRSAGATVWGQHQDGGHTVPAGPVQWSPVQWHSSLHWGHQTENIRVSGWGWVWSWNHDQDSVPLHVSV